jgi:hypothetical protein
MVSCPFCSRELAESLQETQFLQQTLTGLSGLSEEQRVNYVYQVIAELSKVLAAMQGQPIGIQMKILGNFQNAFKENGGAIVEALLYSVKPEYRPAYGGLMQMLSGMSQNVDWGEPPPP